MPKVICMICSYKTAECESDVFGNPPDWAQKEIVDHVWEKHPEIAQTTLGRERQ